MLTYKELYDYVESKSSNVAKWLKVTKSNYELLMSPIPESYQCVWHLVFYMGDNQKVSVITFKVVDTLGFVTSQYGVSYGKHMPTRVDKFFYDLATFIEKTEKNIEQIQNIYSNVLEEGYDLSLTYGVL